MNLTTCASPNGERLHLTADQIHLLNASAQAWSRDSHGAAFDRVLRFFSNPGTVLMCNVDTGFRAPERVKVRPVVVVAPRRRPGAAMTTVVPLSTTAPHPIEPFHHRLEIGHLPGWLAERERCAKGDMIMTVAAIDRLVHHAVIFEMNVENYRRRTASHRLTERQEDRVTDSDN